MSQVICSGCFEVEDTTKRFIELPYICVRCEKDPALAIDQDVWEAEYVGPACQQAAEELHGLYIEEKDNIPCDAPYNSGVPCQSALDNIPSRARCCFDPPCQSALDSVQAGVYDQYAHNSEILDQFNADTEVINDLRAQLDEAHAANVRLTEEIEFCDRRVRAYQQVAAETDKHAAGLEETIEILKSELRGISIRANDAVLDTSF